MRLSQSLRFVAFIVVLMALGALSLMGQSAGTGALTGTVTDPSNSIIANATVTLLSNDTNQTRTVTTGSDGSYKFSLLPPGNYRVTFSAPDQGRVQIGIENCDPKQESPFCPGSAPFTLYVDIFARNFQWR